MPYFKRLLPVRYGIGAAAAAMRYGYGRYYSAISRRRRIANRNYLKGGISRVGYIRKKKRYPRRYRRSRLRVKKNPFRIGRKRGNISRVYRIKCISQVNLEFNWDKDHTGGAQSIADKATTDASIWFGNRYENWEEYARQADFLNFTTERISTRLSDFKVHRIVHTSSTAQDDDTVVSEEDKVTFTDPTVWFYRPHNGEWPGAYTAGTNNDLVFEISKKKCIKDCNDGWWWGKRWRTKSDRIMRQTKGLETFMQNPVNVTWKNAMNVLGIEPVAGDQSYKNQNYMAFSLARQCPYPSNWFTKNMDTSAYKSQERKCTDYLSCLMTTWVSVRFWNQDK